MQENNRFQNLHKNMKKNLAIYVKDEKEYLWLSIVRGGGGIYVNMPRKDLKSHISYHTSGNYWIKHFNKKTINKNKQPLDENFKGFENVVQTGIKRGYGKDFDRSFKPKDFDQHVGVFEDEIPPEGLDVSIDLIEPNTDYNYYENYSSYFRVIKKEVVKDVYPWICITFFQNIGL